MPTQRFSTNLRCAGCVATIKPLLDAAPAIAAWSVETETPQKALTVESRVPLNQGQLNAILQSTEYRVLAELTEATTSSPAEPPTSYFPLLLILFYLLGITAAIELAAGSFHLERAMRHFMAGFFLVFSFFKLLNLQKFADAYLTYDIVAQRSRLYALAYPFIELGLGIAYILHWQPLIVNLITLLVMGVSTIGVVKSLLARKNDSVCLPGHRLQPADVEHHPGGRLADGSHVRRHAVHVRNSGLIRQRMLQLSTPSPSGSAVRPC